MRHGYHKKMCMLRFTCSNLTVHAKIAAFPTEEDRKICIAIRTYLLQSPDSSHKHYFDLQNDLVQ